MKHPSIYKFSLFACLFVCIQYTSKTAEPIGPKCFVGHHMIPGKFASIEIRFLKILKIHEINFLKPANFFYNVHKEKMFTIEMEDGRGAP